MLRAGWISLRQAAAPPPSMQDVSSTNPTSGAKRKRAEQELQQDDEHPAYDAYDAYDGYDYDAQYGAQEPQGDDVYDAYAGYDYDEQYGDPDANTRPVAKSSQQVIYSMRLAEYI